MAVTVTHTKELIAPDSGVEDKVYGADYVAADSHAVTGLGDSAELDVGTGAGTVAAGDHLHTGVYEPAGTAASAVADHEAAANPHPGYLTQAEGDVLYATVDHTHEAGAGVDTANSPNANEFARFTDADTIEGRTAAETRTDLGLVIGTNVQAHSAVLDATTASFLTTDETKLDGIAAGATVGATWGTNVTSQPSIVTQADAEAGSSSTERMFTPQRVGQAIAALAVPSSRSISNGFGITGGGDLTANRTLAVSLTSTSAFATATTTISAATYADIAGCSVSLAAGTWLILGQVNIGLANAIIQAFVAITDGANTVISEVAASRPASGTASLASPFSCNPIAIVSPAGVTTYKLRGARGLTTHTGSWTAMDGNGVNTTNHLTNNTDKGSGIFAVRIA